MPDSNQRKRKRTSLLPSRGSLYARRTSQRRGREVASRDETSMSNQLVVGYPLFRGGYDWRCARLQRRGKRKVKKACKPVVRGRDGIQRLLQIEFLSVTEASRRFRHRAIIVRPDN